tara:strand:+ start:2945 stop:5188 length:2244 start_codon:yes stop_codon:yes gene_type:complete
MKKALLALAIASITANLAVASPNYVFSNDALPPLEGGKVLSMQELMDKKRSLDAQLKSQSVDDKLVQRILVFYQPSYADKFGEDTIHQRIESSILKDYQKVAGDNRTIEIVDIVPLTSVPNHLPYENRVDLSGDLVSLGYNPVNADKDGMYSILDVPLTVNTDEWNVYDYYKPDLVTIFRERRIDEDELLGQGRLGGVNTIILDSGTGLLTPDENNLLTTIVAHEIGHNHSLSHEIYADSGDVNVDVGGVYTSNHAIQCGDAVTVMWSEVGDSIEALNFYSSPEKFHKGEQCGHLSDNEGMLNGSFNQLYYDYYFEVEHSNSASQLTHPVNTMSFVPSSNVVAESDGYFTVSVEREGDISEEAQVYIRSTGKGEANYPEDIMQYKVKVEFAPGQQVAEVRFDIMQDMLVEDTEVVELEMVYPFGAGVNKGTASVILTDSFISPEERGVITLLEPKLAVTEGDVAYIEFSRPEGSKGDVLLSLLPEYHLIEDTGLEMFEQRVWHPYAATEGRDYIMPSKYVVMRDGETSLKVPVQTLDDLDPETVEGMALSLASLSGDTIAFESGISGAILISDDDAERAGVLAIEADELTVKESDGALNFTVFRDLDFEGGVPFEIVISIDYGDGQPNEIKLTSTFELKAEPPIVVTVDGEAIDERRYEAIKYFTHTLNPTAGIIADYTVTVTVNNLVENGLVSPDKNKVIFKIEDDRELLVSSYEGENGGGSTNIVYLLVIGAVAWFRRARKVNLN